MSYQKEPTALVIVASSEQARFLYYLQEERRLVERGRLLNATARKHIRELIADRSGSDHNIAGRSRNAVEQTQVEEDDARIFAAQVSAKIRRDIANRQIRNIVMVATPHILGQLRSNLSQLDKSAFMVQISKDLMHLSEDELLVELAEELSSLSKPG